MNKKRVALIAGVSVIIFVIAGYVFVVKKGSDVPVADKPALEAVQEAEIRKWTEVLSEGDVQVRVVNVTSLRNEPFLTAEEIDQLEVGLEGAEIALCMENSLPMGWSKVEIDGETGYVDMLDMEYIGSELAEEEIPEEEVPAEEPTGESIVDVEVAEEETPVEEETPTEEETTTVVETSTPQEPVTTTTDTGSQVTTIPQEQAQDAYTAEIDAWLESMGAFNEIPTGSAHGDNGVGGQHYGDLE